MSGERYIDGTYLEQNPGWHGDDSAWKAQQCRALLSDLGVNPSTMCDVGCGVGGVLGEMGQSFPDATLTGFDIAPEALAIARRTHPEIHFELGDAAGRHEVLLVLDVVEHIEDCFGFTRSLRPHGDLMIFHIPLELTCLYLMRHVLTAHRESLGHIHYFTRETALALLAETGYEIVATRYTPSVVDFPGKGVRKRVIAALQRMGFRLSPDASVLALGGYALLVAARPQGT